MRGQTYEHLMLSRSMGITNLVVAINKMDHKSVQWSEDIYNKIKNDIMKHIKKLKFSKINFVPISAYNGDNVITPRITNQVTLYDLLTNIEIVEKEQIMYPNVKKIYATCLFIGNKDVIASGYKCTLHSRDNIVDCEIVDIQKTPPFITKRDIKPINVVIEIDTNMDIYDHILLRDGDDTICMGKVSGCD